MSLYKQLWLAVIFLMSIAFGGSYLVSSLSARAYLQEQLYLKNLDNANALALSLSQLAEDPVLFELTLSAQFDTGHYQFIRLTAPSGELIDERIAEELPPEAPLWFIHLLPLDADPGIAQVQRGWEQIGTLTLKSHSRFAYRELWRSTLRLAGYFLLAMLISGLLGTWLLRLITRPLKDVVDQAEAIGERRFIRIAEPRTREFKAVVKAMNRLSSRVKQMLEEESQRLAKWHQERQLDEVTGLLERSEFLRRLEARLERDDASANGTLTLFRLAHLTELNRSQGRAVMDALLKGFGDALNQLVGESSQNAAGRLNGADFIFMAPLAGSAEHQARTVQDCLDSVVRQMGLGAEVELYGAVTEFKAGEHLSSILSRVDTALAAAEVQKRPGLELAITSQTAQQHQDRAFWQQQLEAGFSEQRFHLGYFPVLANDGSLLHQECPLRLQTDDGATLTAGQFMPWIHRLQLGDQLDLHVIRLALETLESHHEPLGINLSPQALKPAVIEALKQQIAAHPEAASRLWLELPEAGVFQSIEGFRLLCQALKPLGCRIGIEHAGHLVHRIGEVHDLGLDYLKVDSSLVRDIDSNTANQVFLRGLCTIVHSIGLRAIAEGVRNNDEWQLLLELGIDGGTGPGIEAACRH